MNLRLERISTAIWNVFHKRRSRSHLTPPPGPCQTPHPKGMSLVKTDMSEDFCVVVAVAVGGSGYCGDGRRRALACGG